MTGHYWVSFVDRLESETYPETPSLLHTEMTGKVLDTLLPTYRIARESEPAATRSY